MSSYLKRYLKVLDYIDSHIDEEVSLERLSQEANLSKFHFHRQFSAVMNLGVHGYVQHLLFKRAVWQLAYRPEIKVIDIALQCRYESAEAFSRAFKQFLGQTPTQFRDKPDWAAWKEKEQLLTNIRNIKMKQKSIPIEVRLVNFESVQIGLLVHKGSPNSLGSSIGQFIEWRKENKLPPTISRTFNILYDDPHSVASQEYRFGLAAEVSTAVADNDYDIVESAIPGGLCAVIRHKGSDNELENLARYLYSDWLDQSGKELRDFPLFLERISFFPEVAEHEAIVDIYLPLKS